MLSYYIILSLYYCLRPWMSKNRSNLIFWSMITIFDMGKLSPQLKFGYYDSQIALRMHSLYHTTLTDHYRHSNKSNLIFWSMITMVFMGKPSPQLKFGYYNARIALRYTIPLPYYHIRLLLALKRCCSVENSLLLCDALRRL